MKEDSVTNISVFGLGEASLFQLGDQRYIKTVAQVTDKALYLAFAPDPVGQAQARCKTALCPLACLTLYNYAK